MLDISERTVLISLLVNSLVSLHYVTAKSYTGGALLFWQRSCPNSYSVLAKFALEMLAPPASQAFVERLFSVCGIMTTDRRNRRRSSSEMRVWLKMNHDVLNHHMPARKRKAML
jgi:hypothetical protein